MEKSKKDALIKRAAAAAVMAPATLAVIYIGIPCFNLFVMFLGCLLAWEWAEMAAPAGKKSLYVSIYAFSVSAAVCYSAGACFGDSRGRLQVPWRKKARAAGAWRSLYNAWARLSGLAVSSDRNGRYVLVLFADLVR